MSFDFATAQLCSHEVYFETLELDPITRDRVQFLRPPSAGSVQLYIDGVLVPPSGLYSRAILPFTRPEPYRIRVGENDLIYIRIGFGAPRFIRLIPGTKVKAVDLASHLQKEIPELSITAENKRVYFRSIGAVNGVAFSFVDPRWTDTTSSLLTTARTIAGYQAVGITPGRSAKGRQIYPSWTIGAPNRQISSLPTTPSDPSSSVLITDRILKFSNIFPNNDPLIQVSYVTTSVNCRRCHGSRIEYDYNVVGGTYEEVRNLDLLAQELDKFLYTKIGTHFKWQWLGSGLIDKIGGKGSTGVATINALITVDIQSAFRTYQSIKEQQEQRFPTQEVTDAEYPFNLDSVEVQIQPEDPTVAIVTTTVTSRTFERTGFERIVGNPNPFTLANDPIQNLRLDPRYNFVARG
jgi:hypothetical protein